MTCEDFNLHYKEFIEEGYYGLEFDIPNVTRFLDKVFQDFIKIPGFKYRQIKLKFGYPRVYTTLSQTMNFLLEQKIIEIIKEDKKIEASKK